MLQYIIDKLSFSKKNQYCERFKFPADNEIKKRDNNTGFPAGIIVAFYTQDTMYENEAKRMRASAQRLGLHVLTQPVLNAGTWVRNASLKAQFLADQRATHRGPLLYVDVDAVFHDDPWPALNLVNADIQVHYDDNGDLLSGTIWIADTIKAQQLLDEWALKCSSNPDDWDQMVLDKMIAADKLSNKNNYSVAKLPVEYCWIFDKQGNYSCKKIFIEHLQASREAKNKKNIFGFASRDLKRRRQRVLEIEEILF